MGFFFDLFLIRAKKTVITPLIWQKTAYETFEP
jgi:hypothetical protein